MPSAAATAGIVMYCSSRLLYGPANPRHIKKGITGRAGLLLLNVQHLKRVTGVLKEIRNA